MILEVGFIGLGEMGKWMALNIIKAGYKLAVYDIRSAPVEELVNNGAEAAKNPLDLAKKTNCIFLSLPDTEIVEKVIFGKYGLSGGMSSGSILVDLSTINYKATLRIEAEMKNRGVTFIDAPVSGMEARAKDGTLTVMVGGDLKTVDSIRPIFNSLGNKIIYMGKSGNGQLTKLMNQLFYNISVAATAELLPMAVKLGLDPEELYKVVTSGTGQTFGFQFFTPLILDNNFEQGYSLGEAYKDMVSAAEISAQESIPLPVFFAALQTYQMSLNQGLEHENKGAMIKVWEKELGIRVRRKGHSQ
jgi:3-hydroxyisobutyrate dehydrogenase-like beta-hydroxyacid dehydrogenase